MTGDKGFPPIVVRLSRIAVFAFRGCRTASVEAQVVPLNFMTIDSILA
jgi:hypothetical protein